MRDASELNFKKAEKVKRGDSAKALTRNLSAFIRFLDIMALQNGEELNYQGIASDSGVPAKTVQNYIQILEDTLIEFQVQPLGMTLKRKAITRSKFFFDIGVVNTLSQRGEIKEKSELFGRAFEHFLMMEFRAYLLYERSPHALQYWRSTSGFEVDCVIGKEGAFEFKSTDLAQNRHLKGLQALKEEKIIKNYALISQDPQKRIVDGITIYPWHEFLSDLWNRKIIP
jgi:uncharacterized protein